MKFIYLFFIASFILSNHVYADSTVTEEQLTKLNEKFYDLFDQMFDAKENGEEEIFDERIGFLEREFKNAASHRKKIHTLSKQMGLLYENNDEIKLQIKTEKKSFKSARESNRKAHLSKIESSRNSLKKKIDATRKEFNRIKKKIKKAKKKNKKEKNKEKSSN